MKKLKKIIKIFIEIFLVLVILFSLYMIIKWFIGTINNRKIKKEVNKEIKIENVISGQREIDFNYLKSINSDVVGYISINELDINYPVVRTTDNNYYLNHSLDKSKNVGGWIFMDYRNTSIDDKNTIIYGHNMKDGSMFGKLKNIKNNDYDTIYYYENNIRYIYKIFSVYEIDEESYYIKTNMDDSEYLDFLNTLKDRSVKKIDYNPSLEDKILTLSTCSSSKKRLVVHAALLLD